MIWAIATVSCFAHDLTYSCAKVNVLKTFRYIFFMTNEFYRNHIILTKRMKSKLLNCIWMLMAAMVMTNCSIFGDDDDAEDFFFEEGKFVLLAEADDRMVLLEFTANNNWEISIDAADWISVSPMSGKKGPQIVTISLQPNTTWQDRSVDFFLESKNEVLLQSFIQRGMPMIFSVKDNSTLTQNLLADETVLRAIEITAPYAWRVLAYDENNRPVTWLTFDPEQADAAGEYTVAIRAQQNFTGADRTAKIIFEHGAGTLVGAVTQKATKANGEKPEMNPVGTWVCTQLVTYKVVDEYWTSTSVKYNIEEMKDVLTMSSDSIFTVRIDGELLTGIWRWWGDDMPNYLGFGLGDGLRPFKIVDATVIEISLPLGDSYLYYNRTYTKVSDNVTPNDKPSDGDGTGKAQ